MADEESGKLHRLFSAADRAEGGPAIDPASSLKGQIASLLWEKRYEEALELLYAARRETPDATEISRGINLLKERLVRRYVEELGDLDAVPSIASGVNRATIEIADEERALLHLIDGISSFADIAHQSRLGRFETYRALGRVVRQGIVEVAPPPAPAPFPAPRLRVVPASSGPSAASSALEKTPPLVPLSEPEQRPPTAGLAPSPPPQRRWRGLLVGAVSFGVTAAVGLTWWAVTGTAPSLHPGAAVAGVPVPRRGGPALVTPGEALAAPAIARPSPPTTLASSGAPGARQVALLEPDVNPASPDLSAARTGTIRRSSRSAGKAEERSKKRSPSRGAAGAESPSAAGRPRTPNATDRMAAAAPKESAPPSLADESDAPSLPDLPETAVGVGVGVGRSAALAAAPSSTAPRPATGTSARAPQGLVQASATSSAPASLSVATSDLTVRGPLGRSVVEQAVARAQADFRACYSARAAALRRTAAGTARISLTIDEAGYATAVSSQGAPLPGLDGCLQEAAGRIRTRVHPDVGLATVAFAVVFSAGGPAR